MNIQKIFEALKEDEQNSALGIICGELESQGYTVAIDGVPVTSSGFYNSEFPHIEKKMEMLDIAIFKGGDIEQEFSLEFIDFHEIVLKRKTS